MNRTEQKIYNLEIVHEKSFVEFRNSLNGRKMPTFPEIFDYLFNAFSSGEKENPIFNPWIAGDTVNYHGVKGIYFIDNPSISENKVRVEEVEIGEKLKDGIENSRIILSLDNKSVFIPYESSENRKLDKNLCLLGLLRTKERVEKFMEMSRKHKNDFWMFFSPETGRIRVPAIRSLGLQEYVCLIDLKIQDRRFSAFIESLVQDQ